MASASDPDDFKMSLMEHLSELRQRLLRVTLAVLVLGTASLIYAREIYGFLMRPVLLALPPDSASLVYTSAIEELNVLMKIGLYAGLFAATPVLLWQIWGFISPGLYDSERQLAGPFIVFGTLAFVAGAAFCYAVLLPQMFQFLLQKEGAAAVGQRLDTARLREDDVRRLLTLGDFERAQAVAQQATAGLEASGEGQATEGTFGVRLVTNHRGETLGRLEALGRVLDATRAGLPATSLSPVRDAVAKHVEAVAAFDAGDLSAAQRLCDEAAAALGQGVPGQAQVFADVWRLERLLGVARATADDLNWTKPMLSMSEQLTLVLVLELAFGLIFELPLVMMVLGLAGVVQSSFLFKYQRHALVVCLIAAAVITPTGDAVNLALMAGPMLLCYELGVVLVWLVERRRAKQLTEPTSQA